MPENHENYNDAASRQRIYRERQRADGFKQNTLWIHIEAERDGRIAAREGKPLVPMQSIHPASWAIGWITERLRNG